MDNYRKICIVTGTRAEYGLLSLLMKEIKKAHDVKLQIIVTGMHLSNEFGLTYKDIERDGFLVDKKVEILLSSDSDTGVSKSIGLGMIGFADALSELQPDIMLVLGDRFEIFSAVSVAMILKIPVAHLHGGELTEGLIDEPIRHSITKMSHLHFTATEEYRNRVIQLGEQPNRVFNVGAIGVDNIKQLSLMSKEELEESMSFKFAKCNLMITFHPVTLEQSTAELQFRNVLNALDDLENTHLIFTKANADMGGRVINRMISDFVKAHPDKAFEYTSLGQLRYLSLMQYIDGVIGNSSSGLSEVPSFKIGTINIGDRQRGRVKADSVIDCDSSLGGIKNAFTTLFSSSFQKKLKYVTNPYGEGGGTKKILEIITSFSLENILKKRFYDV